MANSVKHAPSIVEEEEEDDLVVKLRSKLLASIESPWTKCNNDDNRTSEATTTPANTTILPYPTISHEYNNTLSPPNSPQSDAYCTPDDNAYDYSIPPVDICDIPFERLRLVDYDSLDSDDYDVDDGHDDDDDDATTTNKANSDNNDSDDKYLGMTKYENQIIDTDVDDLIDNVQTTSVVYANYDCEDNVAHASIDYEIDYIDNPPGNLSARDDTEAPINHNDNSYNLVHGNNYNDLQVNKDLPLVLNVHIPKEYIPLHVPRNFKNDYILI